MPINIEMGGGNGGKEVKARMIIGVSQCKIKDIDGSVCR